MAPFIGLGASLNKRIRLVDEVFADLVNNTLLISIRKQKRYLNYIIIFYMWSGPHVKDDDIIQISFLFADADEQGVVNQVCEDFIYKPDAFIQTGTKPYERGHFYWQLNQPLQKVDFEIWKRLMQQVAKRHGCDPQICNPSRIMRLDA